MKVGISAVPAHFTVLISVFFTINIGIGSYFLYFYWYIKKDITRIKFGTRTQPTI